MIIDIGEIHVISVFRVGELEYPTEISDGNGWWYACHGKCTYMFGDALPTTKDFKINILYDKALADAAQTLAASLPVLGLKVTSLASSETIDFSSLSGECSLVLQDVRNSSFAQADLEKLKSPETLFKYDSRAPLIDTKHALDSALFSFYSDIEEKLTKKCTEPVVHNENADWLQNQSEDYRAGYAHAMRDASVTIKEVVKFTWRESVLRTQINSAVSTMAALAAKLTKGTQQ